MGERALPFLDEMAPFQVGCPEYKKKTFSFVKSTHKKKGLMSEKSLSTKIAKFGEKERKWKESKIRGCVILLYGLKVK